MRPPFSEFTLPMFFAMSFFGTAVAQEPDFQPTPTRRQLSRKIEQLIEVQMNGLVPALEAHEAQIHQLSQQISSLESQFGRLEHTSDHRQSALAQAEATLKSWQQKIANQQAELDNLRKQLAALTATRQQQLNLPVTSGRVSGLVSARTSELRIASPVTHSQDRLSTESHTKENHSLESWKQPRPPRSIESPSDELKRLRKRIEQLEQRPVAVTRSVSTPATEPRVTLPRTSRSSGYRPASRLRASSNGPAAYLIHYR